MTVALMAQRHHQRRRTTTLAAGLAGLILAAGVATASDIQDGLASDVVRVLGPTAVPVEIIVDGRDVTLRTSGVITDAQQAAVRSITNIGSVMIEDGS